MSGRVYIIAEAGVNHNGSVEIGCKLIDAAAAAGTDAVKFQTFRADSLVSQGAPKADYQIVATGNIESQHDMLKRLELSEADHAVLIGHCKARAIEFLSTPFDIESLELLALKFGVSRIKISSGDLNNGPLLLAAARTGRPVIMSTGMTTLAEIETALGILAFGYTEGDKSPSLHAFESANRSEAGHDVLRRMVTLLHCTSEYPAPVAEVNLHAMETLRTAFGLAVGYSDHTEGITVPVAAVALGATVIEKHFTLDRNMPGPDHKASLEPLQLKQMVRAIRDTELALGSPIKQPSASELRNMVAARKSLVAARDIRKGEPFTPENLAIKRPGNGLSPVQYWHMLGKIARRDYVRDEGVQP